jgi:WXG100 family type VII secretion target
MDIETLASNGLGTWTVPVADTESLGTDTSKVEAACQVLDAQKTAIDNLIEDLRTKKEELLANWEGASADKFQTTFTSLIDAFMEVPESVKSISNFANEVCESYMRLDSTAE